VGVYTHSQPLKKNPRFTGTTQSTEEGKPAERKNFKKTGSHIHEKKDGPPNGSGGELDVLIGDRPHAVGWVEIGNNEGVPPNQNLNLGKTVAASEGTEKKNKHRWGFPPKGRERGATIGESWGGYIGRKKKTAPGEGNCGVWGKKRKKLPGQEARKMW